MAVKVLHIITQLELGGAQKNVLDILSHLDQSQYETHLISSRGPLAEEAQRLPGLHVTFLPFLKRSINPVFDLAAFLTLAFYIKREKINIVHTHSSKAGILGRWAARLAGADVIIHTVHGWPFHDYLRSFLNEFYIFLERQTAKITTTLIAVSENDIEKGLENGIGSPGQYRLIRCAIDLNSFSTTSVSQTDEMAYSLGLGEGDQVIGMVACLKPQKNPVDFVRVAALVLEKNPGTKFLLVGDGVLRSFIQKEIHGRNLEDHFFMLGWRKDIFKILSVMDIVVLTSLWEGLPLVFLEAMHLCKPIVAYDTGGIKEIVKDGVNGFLVRPRDIDHFSQKLEVLLKNKDLRQRMGRFGQHMVSNEVYQIPYMMQQIEGLYKKPVVS